MKKIFLLTLTIFILFSCSISGSQDENLDNSRKEKQEKEKQEKEKQEKDKQEKDKQEKDKQEKDKQEKDKQEKDKQEKEKQEKERQEKEKQEKERQEKERERREKEKQEKERREKERERQEKERREQEQREKEKQEKILNKRIANLIDDFGEIDKTTNVKDEYNKRLDNVFKLQRHENNKTINDEYLKLLFETEDELFNYYVGYYYTLYSEIKDLIDKYKDILFNDELIASNPKIKEIDRFISSKLNSNMIYNNGEIGYIYHQDFHSGDIYLLTKIGDFNLKQSFEAKIKDKLSEREVEFKAFAKSTYSLYNYCRKEYNYPELDYGD